jgi:hypothetical protein
LKDGGYITVSHDNGKTWRNIINDTMGFGYSWTNQSNYDVQNLYSELNTLYNGEYGFSGNSENWITTKFSWFLMPCKNPKFPEDTAILRFNFISDNIETGKEGWMIDNIRLYSVDLGGGVETIQNPKFKIFPNPAEKSGTIELDRNYQQPEIEIFNIYGQLLMQLTEYNKQTVNFDKQDLKSGIYFLKIKSDNQLIGIQKLIIK